MIKPGLSLINTIDSILLFNVFLIARPHSHTHTLSFLEPNLGRWYTYSALGTQVPLKQYLSNLRPGGGSVRDGIRSGVPPLLLRLLLHPPPALRGQGPRHFQSPTSYALPNSLVETLCTKRLFLPHGGVGLTADPPSPEGWGRALCRRTSGPQDLEHLTYLYLAPETACLQGRPVGSAHEP